GWWRGVRGRAPDPCCGGEVDLSANVRRHPDRGWHPDRVHNLYPRRAGPEMARPVTSPHRSWSKRRKRLITIGILAALVIIAVVVRVDRMASYWIQDVLYNSVHSNVTCAEAPTRDEVLNAIAEGTPFHIPELVNNGV